MELVTKSTFANNKLGRVCSVQAVNAIRSCDSILDSWHGSSAISILKEAGGGQDFLGDVLKSANHVLISTFRSSAHVPCFMDDLLVSRKKLIEIIDRIGKFE